MERRTVKDFLYEEDSYKIRGACFDVWNIFKGMFKEKIIENSLKKELEARGLKVETQRRIDVYYKGERVGVYTPDLIVNGRIFIEIKVKPFLTKEDEKQFWFYFQGSSYKLGFLINFGSKKLEIKRRIYDKAHQRHESASNQRSHQRFESASTRKGFTLIEIIVSISIFLMAVLVAVGMLNQVLRAQRKVFATRELIDNARFVQESIARAIRMSKISTASVDGNTITMTHPTKGIVTYALASGRVRENGTPITSSKINVTNFWFDLEGVGTADELQPRVTIIIQAQDTNNQSSINLQTTMSQRELDI